MPSTGRVARPVIVASVEGEEVGFLAPEPRRHPRLVRIHREVNQCTLLECKQQITLVPVVLVLVDRGGGALSGQRVLEFDGDDGDAVDGKGHVDDAAAVFSARHLHDGGEGDLARDRQPVPGVVLGGLRIHGCVRPEIGHAEGLAVAFEPVAQDVECALELQLLRQAVQYGRGGNRP